MISGFLPIIDENARILILGSMPSVTSLSHQEYYAHSQNRFWKIMQSMFADSFNDYDDKIQCLHRNGIALWDVIAMCEREGSLDSNISNVRENDILGLLASYPSIRGVICNGQKAGSLFRKYFAKRISLPVVVLPSTSPANASYSSQRLTEVWCEALFRTVGIGIAGKQQQSAK